MKRRITHDEILDREIAVIGLFCTKKPSRARLLAGGDELQSWVGENLKSEFSFCTTLSVLDAASDMARSMIANGDETLNLKGD